MRRPRAVWALIVALAVQGVAAPGGGVVLLADTDGDLLGLDPATLEDILDTYLIPGLLLVIPLGVVPLVVVWALLRRPRWRWAARLEYVLGTEIAGIGALAVGFGLIVWIVVEVVLIDLAWLQVVFGVLGVAITGLALLPSVRHHAVLASVDGA